MQITKLVLVNFSSYEGKTVFDFTVKKRTAYNTDRWS